MLMRGAIIVLLSTVTSTLGCGSSPQGRDTATVAGALSTTTWDVTHMQAIVRTRSSGTYRTAVGADGRFSLRVPAGQSYELLIARVLPSSKQQVLGHLAVRRSAGTSVWIAPRGTLALGRLVPAGTAPSTGLTTKSVGAGGEAESGEAESDDDGKEEAETSEDDAKSLCAGGAAGAPADQELTAENEPGDDAVAHEQESDDDAIESCGDDDGS
jgi:hypothetical protein